MVSAATAFPNVSFVHNWPQIDDAGTVVPFISIRQWQPVSSTETEVLSWFAVDREAPESFKHDSYRAYLMCFGSSGMFSSSSLPNPPSAQRSPPYCGESSSSNWSWCSAGRLSRLICRRA